MGACDAFFFSDLANWVIAQTGSDIGEGLAFIGQRNAEKAGFRISPE